MEADDGSCGREMMKPTDEQLRDPKWWDENAPDGATHIFTSQPCLWYKPGFYWSFHEIKWVTSESMKIGEVCLAKMIPRPSKPAAPDDGELCVVWDDECNQGTFFLCEYQEDGPRFQQHPKGGCFYPDELSGYTKTGIVIRTKEQREREELGALVLQAYKSDPKNAEEAISRIADAILSRYNLEPKQ